MAKAPVKLNKKFKQKWVNALRSGKFKQASGALMEFAPSLDDELNDTVGVKTHCCLGVACAISGIDDGDIENDSHITPELITRHKHKLSESDRQGLAKLVFEDESDLANKLAGFNDNGKSFNWIAGYIDRYL